MQITANINALAMTVFISMEKQICLRLFSVPFVQATLVDDATPYSEVIINITLFMV